VVSQEQESLANAKVSVRQQCVYEVPSEEIYGKSTQGTYSVEKYIQWGTTVLSSFIPKSAKSREISRDFEVIADQGHPRSSILVSIESAYAISY